jgi:hypothetical protein
MNIFYLDRDPTVCAKYHCNKHVVKMVLETAQLLSNAHWLTNGSGPYKLTHAKHPCTQWVLKSKENYTWLANLGLALAKEYTHRYGKVHKTQSVIEYLISNVPSLPEEPFTDPPQCMPEFCKQQDTVEAYRNYYVFCKATMLQFPMLSTPKWIQNRTFIKLKKDLRRIKNKLK